jgi:hypothetical protein
VKDHAGQFGSAPPRGLRRLLKILKIGRHAFARMFGVHRSIVPTLPERLIEQMTP